MHHILISNASSLWCPCRAKTRFFQTWLSRISHSLSTALCGSLGGCGMGGLACSCCVRPATSTAHERLDWRQLMPQVGRALTTCIIRQQLLTFPFHLISPVFGEDWGIFKGVMDCARGAALGGEGCQNRNLLSCTHETTCPHLRGSLNAQPVISTQAKGPGHGSGGTPRGWCLAPLQLLLLLMSNDCVPLQH